MATEAPTPVESGPDLLRRAAERMRERATAASPGPWETYMTIHAEAWVCEVDRGGFGAVALPATGRPDYGKANSEHVASWHPPVALAVADLLERDAEGWEQLAEVLPPATTEGEEAFIEAFAGSLAVARVYLGEVS